ncbi:MAG TPA: hypothetical protein ENK08_08390 [Chloroflexi bacterium]|nr:hypothetical protein [Chloroflexota bacterium]
MGWKRKAMRTDELLSAYLDGELNPKERARLEARLAADPDLRERLEELRRTIALVRGLPRVKAPRNFLLTPEMVAPARRRPVLLGRRLAPVLTLATAMSALACAVVLIGNLLTFGLGGMGAAPAAAPPRQVALEPATEEAALAPLPEEATEEEPMIAAGVVTATAKVSRTVVPEAALAPGRAISPTIVPSPSPTPQPQMGAADTGREEAGPGTPAPPAPAAEKGGTLPPGAPPPSRPGWPLLAGGLALLTLVLLVVTVLAWRAQE